MLEKIYNPKKVEQKWQDLWEKNRYFENNSDSSNKIPYSIVIPPPNVTGILHMGHALNNTIQDIFARYHRLFNQDVQWVPGTDHAGIATQNVVEKHFAKEGLNRHHFGREEFIEKVWEWKHKHGDVIKTQLTKLGASCNWSRARFTLDENCSHAVQQTFIDLYQDNLIYRGNYIINWCPRCQTALSDEEAEHVEKDSHIYHIKYDIYDENQNKTDQHIVIATTRPETLFGDQAIAIHPKDSQAKELASSYVKIPLIDRYIPFILDSYVDQEFGTGRVKVTPAHDPNDFEMAQRHKLEPLNIMTKDGKLSQTGSKDYDGLDRFEARKKLCQELEQTGQLIKTEAHTHAVGECYRCHTVVEPRLSNQWFVKMKPLAQPALEAFNNQSFQIHPKRWGKIYVNWLESIRDWCISRQIWWGHRIPVWYCTQCCDPQPTEQEIKNYQEYGNTIFDEADPILSVHQPQQCSQGHTNCFVQDTDVLDTWFSSWLWPMVCFGWPQSDSDCKRYYPTDILCTAPEILFFWVARMVMSGLYYQKQVPFKQVYLHGTVRDDSGVKMSKSLGNTIDPLEVIEEFSADALRFTLMMITGGGQDVYLSKKKFEIGRNFLNKIWNSTRFLLMRSQEQVFEEVLQPSSPAEKWIASEFNQLLEEYNEDFKKLRIYDTARRLYDFFWSSFCDSFLEMLKAQLDENHGSIAFTWGLFKKILLLMHPFIPFITEELYQNIPLQENRLESLSQGEIPQPYSTEEASLLEGRKVQECISAIRSLRKESNIPLGKKVPITLITSSQDSINILQKWELELKKISSSSKIQYSSQQESEENTAVKVLDWVTISLSLEDHLDKDKEIAKLEKKWHEIQEIAKKLESRLSNQNFIQKAPQEIIQKEKEKCASYHQLSEEIQTQIARLKKG